MLDSEKLPRWATVALLLAAVLAVFLVLNNLAEPTPSSTSPVGSSAAERIREPAREPLPPGVTSVEHLIDHATAVARKWRDDATLTRLYATSVAADGGLDRDASVAQLVFVSPSATSEQQLENGFRWLLQEGKTQTEEISVLPAPQLPGAPAKLCALAPMLGQGAPERVTLDITFAPRVGSEPVLNAFTREPRKWVVTADPRSCEVHGRSQETTEQEKSWADASDAAGAWFDAPGAARAVSHALARASACAGDAGPHGDGTLAVTFDKKGRVLSAELVSGPFSDTEAGRCIIRLVEPVRVPAWEQGDGRTAARFKL